MSCFDGPPFNALILSRSVWNCNFKELSASWCFASPVVVVLLLDSKIYQSHVLLRFFV